jgi:DNA-directed RNA polymerase specialized sigma24 family protein
MKRQNFMKAIDTYSAAVTAWLAKKIRSREYAIEAVQEMIVAQLASKAYCRFTHDAIDGRIYTYLKQAAKHQHATNARKALVEESRVCSIELEASSVEPTASVDRVVVNLEHECPFCHKAELNIYQACALCHTIVGRGVTHREQIHLTEADLLSCPDISLTADIEQAFAKLTPIEQNVIKHAVYGNETLDDLAGEGNQAARQSLWRTYVKAKRKLQESLLDYAC